MAVLADLHRIRAAQDVDHVRRAETLSAAVDARQHFLRGDGAVPALRRLQAVVAMPAGAGMRLAEIRQQRLSPAAGGFAETDQRIELAALQALALIAGLGGF